MDAMKLHATAHVKLIKKDSDGNVVDVKEHDVELTKEEALELWRSQQQA